MSGHLCRGSSPTHMPKGRGRIITNIMLVLMLCSMVMCMLQAHGDGHMLLECTNHRCASSSTYQGSDGGSGCIVLLEHCYIVCPLYGNCGYNISVLSFQCDQYPSCVGVQVNGELGCPEGADKLVWNDRSCKDGCCYLHTPVHSAYPPTRAPVRQTLSTCTHDPAKDRHVGEGGKVVLIRIDVFCLHVSVTSMSHASLMFEYNPCQINIADDEVYTRVLIWQYIVYQSTNPRSAGCMHGSHISTIFKELLSDRVTSLNTYDVQGNNDPEIYCNKDCIMTKGRSISCPDLCVVDILLILFSLILQYQLCFDQPMMYQYLPQRCLPRSLCRRPVLHLTRPTRRRSSHVCTHFSIFVPTSNGSPQNKDDDSAFRTQNSERRVRNGRDNRDKASFVLLRLILGIIGHRMYANKTDMRISKTSEITYLKARLRNSSGADIGSVRENAEYYCVKLMILTFVTCRAVRVYKDTYLSPLECKIQISI